ncbi:MAG: hypothetical protein J0J05_11695 [Microbacterium sp.]|uniref:hypothetical protein n=1 Tax=Microbacterium sp. TaxID=51671 RepID=UPI001AC114EC|nr:hypothetical protein [Microbacterium sp.]MBN9154636.1 hypothetical protein [Microbacterium sp.]
MRTITRTSVIVTSLVALATSLAGCSLNEAVWGREGARVIDTTTRFIGSARDGDTSALICPGRHPDVRSRADWANVHAEEPEKFDTVRWPDLLQLHPTWIINLSTVGSAAPGDEQPGTLVYGQTKEGFCVLEVFWMTVGSVSE